MKNEHEQAEGAEEEGAECKDYKKARRLSNEVKHKGNSNGKERHANTKSKRLCSFTNTEDNNTQ